MTRPPSSLAGALYRRVILAVASVGLLMAALSLAIANQALDRDSDAQLVTAANVLFALMQDELSEAQSRMTEARPIEVGDELLSSEDARAFHASADWRMFFVFRDGTPLLRSDTAPPPASIPRKPGFHDFRAGTAAWRSYGLAVPRYGLLLVVGERVHSRRLVIREIMTRLLLPLFALLPMTALLLHLSLRSGLASLRRLSGDLAERSPQDLSRLDMRAWPRDLSLLISALNRLFERVEEALDREQGFTDDAAHQLRTPLAALRIQSQTVIAALPDGERDAGHVLLASVDRASALVDRMLQLARLESVAIDQAPGSLFATVAAVVADHALLAAQKDVEFDVEGDRTPPVVTDHAILAVALAAVLENAVKHSPAGGRIMVRLTVAAAGPAIICVTDQGHGIPPEDRERLFHRFARGSGLEAGAGLGLTIARRAMALLGGTIDFADPPEDACGVTVLLTLPSSPDPARWPVGPGL